MQRYFFEISYKGTNFFGWQIQPNQISVQENIEKALSNLNKGLPVKIVGCGRTDTGVHSSQYFFHCDLDIELSVSNIIFKVNAMVSKDISIKNVFKVNNKAHARFDAISRTYHYFIHNDKDAFIHETSWYNHKEYDLDLMNEACTLLLNHSNFECFSKVKTEVNNFNCNISKALWLKTDKGLVFTVTANRFLRNMVRAIVGTLLDVGLEKISISEFKKILDSNNRSEAGQSVPACGLFLGNIEYPNSTFLD